MIKNVPTECLLHNIIGEDFQTMLFPLSIFQILFLIARFNIINNFITPKSIVSHYIESTIGIIIFILCMISRFFFLNYAAEGFKSPVITFFMYFDVVFYSIIIITMYIVSASQSGSTVELIIKLQKVLNSIQIDKKAFLFKIKIQNWISILLLVSVYSVYLLVPNGIEFGLFSVSVNTVMILPSFIFDVQIVNVTRTVVLIKNELVAWNNIMKKYEQGNITTEEEIKNNDPSEKDMFDAYFGLVRAFQLCNKVYRFSFTFIGFETFIHILANLQLVLEFGKSAGGANFFKSTLMRLMTAGWNLKNFILMTLLSIACENFYVTATAAEATCAQILGNDQATGMRQTCKNVTRVRRAALRKLSACGVFEVDATLPLRMLTTLLAYTVVLLQFAFL